MLIRESPAAGNPLRRESHIPTSPAIPKAAMGRRREEADTRVFLQTSTDEDDVQLNDHEERNTAETRTELPNTPLSSNGVVVGATMRTGVSSRECNATSLTNVVG